jgi:hypothetical protein
MKAASETVIKRNLSETTNVPVLRAIYFVEEKHWSTFSRVRHSAGFV